ncbi:MAG: FHA domain-containing protein [Chitinophagaceae bacterium]|nr:MAG: FHA domain-containing protein [Chitinophagaceae bacterium]
MGLFDRLRNDTADAKSIRDDLVYAIRTRLAAFQGAEARGLRAITLYLAPQPAERATYEAAILVHEPGSFRTEVARAAQDFDLSLPENWELKTEFCTSLPTEAIPVDGHAAAMLLQTGQRPGPAVQSARLRVLSGDTGQEEYQLQPDTSRVNIGREARVQLPDGFVRINTIAFSGESESETNRFVSRQHAHIRYDASLGQFLLFADGGGLPPHNKTKVKGVGSETAIKLQSAEVPHLLRNGDQIMLGHSALLEFITDQQSTNG